MTLSRTFTEHPCVLHTVGACRHPDSNWKLFFSRMKPSFGRLFFDTPGRAYNWTNGFNGTNYTDDTNGTGRYAGAHRATEDSKDTAAALS